MPNISLRYWDPDGEKFGLPTWPVKMGPDPEVLATVRQLKQRGLRPGGHEPAGQLGWRISGGDRFAYLYPVARAKPRRPMTEARWAAIAKALRARRICPECNTEQNGDIPRKTGRCDDCEDRATTGLAGEEPQPAEERETKPPVSTDQSEARHPSRAHPTDGGVSKHD
ncbi:RRQRL motif-containing zinc-binding protein [Streptomyces aurantiacus]|nr:RRQRL motif-containing zinc-binding protein [Streptomyces aurantiacus]